MKFCMNCGCVVSEDQKYCNECGAELGKADDNMQALMKKTAENEKNRMNSGITTQPEPMNIMNGLGMGMMGFGLFNQGRYFSYNTCGMMFNSGYDLEVRESEGKLTALYRGTLIARENAKQFEVDDDFFDKITAIINKYNGDGWNGFNGHAEGVFDGDSFSFSFNDGKGRNIHAGGYMMWPDGLGPAIREIKALFDAMYAALYPNLFKIMERYIEEKVIPKYGYPYRDLDKSSTQIGKMPYFHDDPGTYLHGENDMPEGVMGYEIFSGYEGKDKNNPGYRAVVIRLERETIEGVKEKNAAIKLQYYGIESDRNVKFLQEIVINGTAVVGNYGEYSLFYFGSPDEMTLCIYRSREWVSGETEREITLWPLKLGENFVKDLGRAVVTVPRDTCKLDGESIEKLCRKAAESGLGWLDTTWKNEWTQKGIVTCPLVTSIVRYYWQSNKKFSAITDTDGTLRGTKVDDWWVDIYLRR